MGGRLSSTCTSSRSTSGVIRSKSYEIIAISEDSSTKRIDEKIIESSHERVQTNDNSFKYPVTALSKESVTHQPTYAWNELFTLCEAGVLSTMKFIVDHHPHVESMMNNRKTSKVFKNLSLELSLLQVASACGHEDIVKYLLSLHRIYVNLTEPTLGYTALHLAILCENVHVVELLCKDSRVNLREKTFDGKTALHLAIEHKLIAETECILRVCSHHIDILAKDFDGNSYLHSAALNPSPPILRMLLTYVRNLHQSSYCRSPTADHQVYSDSSTEISSELSQQLASTFIKCHKKLIEIRNYEGLTAREILLQRVHELEKQLTIQSRNSPKNEIIIIRKDDCEENSTIKSAADSLQIALTEAIECLELLSVEDQSLLRADSLTSFGHHSPSYHIEVPLKQEKKLSVYEYAYDDEEEEKHDVKAAYSWSPQNEKLSAKGWRVSACPLSIYLDS